MQVSLYRDTGDDDDETEIVCEFEYYPGSGPTGPRGEPPINPGYDDSYELLSATDAKTGEIVELTPSERSKFEDAAAEKVAETVSVDEEEAAARDRQADYAYDQSI